MPTEIGQQAKRLHITSPTLVAEDISIDRSPLASPTSHSPRVLVIGGGVIGLTTAWALLDRGYHVTIVASEWATYGSAPRLASQIAGALWELPPAGCGPQAIQDKLHMVQRWALESLEVFRVIAKDPNLSKHFGVKMRMFTAFHLNNIDEDKIKKDKIGFIKDFKLDGYTRGAHLFEKYGVNVDSHGGLKDAYEHLAPIIDTDVAMAFITRLVRAKGATMETDTIHGDILHQEAHLLDLYQADAIVNATGVWARETAADDEVYPLRGGLLRLINDGTNFPKIENAMVVSSESKYNGDFRDMAFLVPRNDNILLLGSILHQEAWDLDLTVDCDAVREMRARCEDLVPLLKKAKVDARYPLAQGRRPMRVSHVRVEREQRATPEGRRSQIVHSYGHGGGGWSFSFGSAREVVRLIQKGIALPRNNDDGSGVPLSRL